MHEYDLHRLLGFPCDDNKPASAKLDGRTKDARFLRDTRAVFLSEFPNADKARLQECVMLSTAIARLQPLVLAGDASAISTLTKATNRVDRLRRELRAAERKEHVDA